MENNSIILNPARAAAEAIEDFDSVYPRPTVDEMEKIIQRVAVQPFQDRLMVVERQRNKGLETISDLTKERRNGNPKNGVVLKKILMFWHRRRTAHHIAYSNCGSMFNSSFYHRTWADWHAQHAARLEKDCL
jgi:hypothetical protein